MLLAVLALLAALSGCQSISHPPEKKEAPDPNRVTVPSGEAAPFGT
jgi:hypothetical protein